MPNAAVTARGKTNEAGAFYVPFLIGIYDDVSLVLSDSPAIESVQVAPHIQSSAIVVETELVNVGPARWVTLTQQVKTWKGGRRVGTPAAERVSLGADERKTVRHPQ